MPFIQFIHGPEHSACDKVEISVVANRLIGMAQCCGENARAMKVVGPDDHGVIRAVLLSSCQGDYAIVLLDLDGTILSWNRGVEEIKGYKPGEIIGQNFNIFYLPLDRQEWLSGNSGKLQACSQRP